MLLLFCFCLKTLLYCSCFSINTMERTMISKYWRRQTVLLLCEKHINISWFLAIHDYLQHARGSSICQFEKVWKCKFYESVEEIWKQYTLWMWQRFVFADSCTFLTTNTLLSSCLKLSFPCIYIIGLQRRSCKTCRKKPHLCIFRSWRVKSFIRHNIMYRRHLNWNIISLWLCHTKNFKNKKIYIYKNK